MLTLCFCRSSFTFGSLFWPLNDFLSMVAAGDWPFDPAPAATLAAFLKAFSHLSWTTAVIFEPRRWLSCRAFFSCSSSCSSLRISLSRDEPVHSSSKISCCTASASTVAFWNSSTSVKSAGSRFSTRFLR